MKQTKVKICSPLKLRLWLLFLGSFYSLYLSDILYSTPPKENTPQENPVPSAERRQNIEKIDPFLQALISAYMTNSQLRSKVEAQKAIDEQIAVNQGKFRPNLSINATTGKTRNENQTAPLGANEGTPKFRQRDTTTPSTAGLTITQSLYNGGSDVASTESASNKALAGQYDYLDTEQTTLLNAVSAYMQVIYTQSAVEVNKSNEKFLSESLAAVKVQVEVGEKTLTDQSAAEASLAEAVSNRVAAEAELERALATYETVIGMKPGLLIKPDPLKGLPLTQAELVDIAKDSNVGILKAIYTEKQAKSDIDAARGALLPRVDLQGSASRNLQSGTDRRSRSNQASAQLKLTIPLYQGGGEWASIRQQTATATQARFDLEQARKQAVQDAITAWSSWQAAKKKIDQYVAQVKAAERSRDGAALEAEVGERSYVEVLDAQQKLLAAQLSLLQATRDEYIAQYQVLQVVGQLTADYLHLPVERYNIKEHFEEVQKKWAGG